MRARSAHYLLPVALLLLSACSNTPAKDTPHFYEPSVGDRIILVTKDSAVYEFEVTELTDTAIIGASVKVPYRDVRTIEKDEPPPPPSKFEEFSSRAIGLLGLLLLLGGLFI